MAFVRSSVYVQRPTHFVRLIEREGWRLKLYDIHCESDALEEPTFDSVLPELLALLPSPAAAINRPGVGFILRHQGPTAQYAVLCWWDSQNELPTRLRVRDRARDDNSWRKPTAHESICVHDLDVIWFERGAYLEHVLTRADAPDVNAYLTARFTQTA